MEKEVKPYANNRIDYVVNLISPKKNMKVLNLGVSNIPEIEMLIESKVAECHTFDLDKAKLDNASKFLKKTKLIQGDFFNNKLKKNYYDVIVVLEVFEHLRDDVLAMEICRTLLKKNGRLILSVPNKNALHIINPVKYAEHERHYSNEGIKFKLNSLNFKIEHFNVVENFSLLANLYIHLFNRFILRRARNFVIFKSGSKTYMQDNKSGLDIILMARKHT